LENKEKQMPLVCPSHLFTEPLILYLSKAELLIPPTIQHTYFVAFFSIPTISEFFLLHPFYIETPKNMIMALSFADSPERTKLCVVAEHF